MRFDSFGPQGSFQALLINQNILNMRINIEFTLLSKYRRNVLRSEISP